MLQQMEKSKENSRPSWDDYYMTLAEVTATRATCKRLKVGAVIVKGDLSVHGYNGAPSGEPHCTEVGCLILTEGGGCKRTVHAEENAIRKCKENGIDTEGAIIYVTHSPCPDCLEKIKNAGIKEVVYKHPYRKGIDPSFFQFMSIRQYK